MLIRPGLIGFSRRRTEPTAASNTAPGSGVQGLPEPQIQIFPPESPSLCEPDGAAGPPEESSHAGDVMDHRIQFCHAVEVFAGSGRLTRKLRSIGLKGSCGVDHKIPKFSACPMVRLDLTRDSFGNGQKCSRGVQDCRWRLARAMFATRSCCEGFRS